MAYPTIKVDSTSGSKSDTNCSGAGPATAINNTTEGTTASYSGTTITFSGATNLSGVLSDGSHCLYLLTSTGRRFFKITGVNDGADTVTVAEAPTGTTSGLNWAIGGVRATVFGTETWNLCDRAGGAGDARGGWTLQMQSGHTEDLTTYQTIRVPGDATGGVFTFQGEPDAATRPIITTTVGTSWLAAGQDGISFKNFQFTCDSTARCIQGTTTSGNMYVKNVWFVKGTTASSYGIYVGGVETCIEDCKFIGSSTGAYLSNNKTSHKIRGCYFEDCAIGIEYAYVYHVTIHDCIFVNATSYGIRMTSTGAGPIVSNCVFDGCADAMSINTIPTTTSGLQVYNNQITNCTDTGIHLYNATADDPNCREMFRQRIYNNNIYNCTTARVQLDTDTTNYNDLFGTDNYQPFVETVAATRKSTGNWAVNASAKEKGYPTAVISGTTTRSYMDQGPQRQEPAASGTTYIRRTQDALIGR